MERAQAGHAPVAGLWLWPAAALWLSLWPTAVPLGAQKATPLTQDQLILKSILQKVPR